MSELTPCNYHSLQYMKQRAEKRGVKVIVAPGKGEFAGWTVARYSDEVKPSSYFMELTDHCVC